MAYKEVPYRKRLFDTAVGGTYDYLYGPWVREGELHHYQIRTYENQTGARGALRVYIEGHGYDHLIYYNSAPGSASPIRDTKNVWLYPGERIVFRQASCTASDVLEACITGQIQFGEPEKLVTELAE